MKLAEDSWRATVQRKLLLVDHFPDGGLEGRRLRRVPRGCGGILIQQPGHLIGMRDRLAMDLAVKRDARGIRAGNINIMEHVDTIEKRQRRPIQGGWNDTPGIHVTMGDNLDGQRAWRGGDIEDRDA